MTYITNVVENLALEYKLVRFLLKVNQFRENFDNFEIKYWHDIKKLGLFYFTLIIEVVKRSQKLMLKRIFLLRSCHCFLSQVKGLKFYEYVYF